MAHILVTIRFHKAGWRCGPAGSSSASRPPTSSLIAPVWPFRRPLRHWCQGSQACFPWAPARTEFPLSPVGRTPPWPGCPHRSRHLCFLAGAGAHRRELRAARGRVVQGVDAGEPWKLRRFRSILATRGRSNDRGLQLGSMGRRRSSTSEVPRVTVAAAVLRSRVQREGAFRGARR